MLAGIYSVWRTLAVEETEKKESRQDTTSELEFVGIQRVTVAVAA